MSCVVCWQKFTDASKFHEHVKLSHSGLMIFICDLCLDSFLYEKDMQRHRKDVHGSVPVKIDSVATRRQTRATIKRNLQRTSKRLENHRFKKNSCINGVQKTVLKKMPTKGTRRSSRNYQSKNNVEDIKAKYGCLKQLTIPLTRIDNHPLLKQTKSRNRKGKCCVNNTIKNVALHEEEEEYVVKVKKKKDSRSFLTISCIKEKEKEKQLQDDTQKSLSIIENSILERLVSKWRKKKTEDISELTNKNYNPVLKSTKSLKNAIKENNSSTKVTETIYHQSPRKSARNRKQSASSVVEPIKQTTCNRVITSVSCQAQVNHMISATEHNSTETLDSSNLTPMKMLSKALERCNNHPFLRNVNGRNVKNRSFFRKQNRSLMKIRKTFATNDPKLLKRIDDSALPTRMEITSQTAFPNEDDHKAIETAQYIMTALKSLNPTLINVKKKDALLQNQNKDKTYKSLISRIIGICFTCLEVDKLIKQLQATTMASQSKQIFMKCPLCVQTFQSLNSVETHLKVEHLQCIVKQKKIYLPVKVIDSLETLYSSIDKELIFDCRCCKKEFHHAEQFIQHIRNLHDETTPAIKLEQMEADQTVDATSRHEDFHVIPVKRSAENNVTCTDSEIIPNNAVDQPVKEEQVDNADHVIEKIDNNTSVNGNIGKEIIIPDNQKRRKLTIPSGGPEKPYFCVVCFNSFDTSKEFLQHIGMGCYLDNSSKNSTWEEKDTESKEYISMGRKKTSSTSLGSDLNKRNKIETEPTENDTLDSATDIHFCSSTSNKQVDLDNSESMDSSITINSEQTVIIPGGACNVCGKKFDNQRSLSEHMYFLHDITLEESIIEDMLKTQSSTEEMETVDSALWETVEEAYSQSAAPHTAKNTNYTAEAEKFWRCFQCGELFSAMESLMHHRYTEHGDESAVHVCENCSEILVSLHSVNMHLCNNVTSWSCKRCNTDFLNSAALKSHNMQKHLEKIGPHICSKCNKRFLTLSMLERHALAVHTKRHDTSVRPSIQDSQRTRMSSSRISSAEGNTKTNSLTENSAKVIADSHGGTSIMFDVDRAIAWKEENVNSTVKLFESDLFMCGICPAISSSKTGIKSHIRKQHKIGAEACQLCNKLYSKDSMGKHLIYHHVILPNYCNRSEPISGSLHSERLLTLLDKKQLLMCCEYQKFIDMLRTEVVTCARCLKQFLNGRFYRIHFLWSHDTSCLLCHEDFGTPARAVDHKIKAHHSIGTYIWMIERVVKALLDVKVYGKTVEAIVKKLNEIQDDPADNCSNVDLKGDNYLEGNAGPQKENTKDMEVSKDCSSQDSGTTTICEETLVLAEDNNSLHGPESSKNNEPEYLAAADDELEQCDDRQPILIITEDDLLKYKHDIKTFVRNLCGKSSLFSEEYVTNLLTNYLNAAGS